MTKDTQRPDSHSRRRLLKAVGAGGGLASAGAIVPNQWRRPVVDAVLLPVHAQTSGGWYGVLDIEVEANAQDAPRNTFFAHLFDALVPGAHAGGDAAPFVYRTHICIAPPVDEQYWIDIVVENFFEDGGGARFDGMLKLDNIHRELNVAGVGSNCPPVKLPGSLEARLNSIDSNAHGDLLDPDGGGIIPFSLPMQPCNLPGLGSCRPEAP